MNVVTCFLLTRLDECEVSFRAFHMGDRSCSARPGPHSFCRSAVVIIGTEPYVSEYEGEGTYATPEQRTDARYPTTCAACGRTFDDPKDVHYIDRTRLYLVPHTGAKVQTRKAPPGAMWFEDWRADPSPAPNSLWSGPDGRCLSVMLPDGTPWCVDGFATNGAHQQRAWTRTGTPPQVTANPSIATPGYHGFLRNGRLESC